MQITALNYWHFLALTIIFFLFLGGVVSAMNKKNSSYRYPMIFSVTLINLFLAIFSVIIVDKYTKEVSLHKLKNKRLLSTEQIVYSGVVRNDGDYPVGKVVLEIKLVNKGHATGNVKGGNFYKATGFFDFFSEGFNARSKPQTLTKKFIIARNLQPGHIKMFRVYFKYPPYFSNVAQFLKVKADTNYNK